MTAPTITELNVGDTVPIGQALVNMILMGMVTDINSPNMFAATLQALRSQAVLTVPVLQGVKGNDGQPSFALRWQNQVLASQSALPTLTNLPTDLGKFWIFPVTDNNGNVTATTMSVWFGTALGYLTFPVGSPGPPGPYPVITPIINLVLPGNGGGPNGADSWIAVTGTISNPTFTFNIAAPQGIAGPIGTLSTLADVDTVTHVPAPGDFLVVTSRTIPGAPNGLVVAPSGTGGTFAAGSYFWVVTALLPNGQETVASNEISTTFGGSTSSAVLTWNPSAGAGATGYKVYRGTQATQISRLVGTLSGLTSTSFTDTGAAGTAAAPPSVGVVAGRPIWAASSSPEPVPQLYTFPESAFSSVSGVGGASVPVGSFAIPPQPWPWKPFVFGQMQIFGVNVSASPLLVGAQVLLGSPTSGQQVAEGVGNSLGAVTIIPKTSNSKNTSAAMTPTNTIGLVQANHTGNQGTLYVSLVNQGMAGSYDFNSQNAQLVVLVIPIPK